MLNAPRTMVTGNKILDNKAAEFWGILLVADPGAGGVGPTDPQDVQIVGNNMRGNANGLKIEAGKGIVVKDNIIEGNGTDYLNLSRNPVAYDAVPFPINPVGPAAQTGSPYNAARTGSSPRSRSDGPTAQTPPTVDAGNSRGAVQLLPDGRRLRRAWQTGPELRPGLDQPCQEHRGRHHHPDRLSQVQGR